jgi:hypothetical protein
MGDIINGQERDVDLLSQNYINMNETGKEKLKKVSKQLLGIWNTVNDENSNSTNELKNVELENE